MNGAELAGRMEGLQRLEEATPELLLDLFGQVAVVDVLVDGGKPSASWMSFGRTRGCA